MAGEMRLGFRVRVAVDRVMAGELRDKGGDWLS